MLVLPGDDRLAADDHHQRLAVVLQRARVVLADAVVGRVTVGAAPEAGKLLPLVNAVNRVCL